LKSTDPLSDPVIIAAQQALDGLNAPPSQLISTTTSSPFTMTTLLPDTPDNSKQKN
jgi:hypothetical protein